MNVKPENRKIRRVLYVLCGALALLSACGPRIYHFRANPLTTNDEGQVALSWAVKGEAKLFVHDLNYPGSGSGHLADITLIVTQHGTDKSYTLSAADTLKIPLLKNDSLSIRRKEDGISDDRLRYFTLVAAKNHKESDSVRQVALRPDTARDEIGYKPVLRGDSLVAEGINDPVRWGDSFEMLSITDGATRPLTVTHAGITAIINPGDQPFPGFAGTPVKGYWQFRTLATAAEKNHTAPLPRLIKIIITIKYHANVPAKH